MGMTMARTSRLDHEGGAAQRGIVAALVAFVLVTFVGLAAGTTIYDVGKWLAIW